MLSKAGLILQHGADGPPARFGDWLHARGLPFEVHHVWEQPPPHPGEFSFVASLGSECSAGETDGWVPIEIAMLRDAVAADVPVLGLCFGGQALAVALGGAVERMEMPEIGWIPVDSADPSIPAGPWLQYHRDRIKLPLGVGQIASSPAGPAAFRYGRHLGLQFHPEADADLVDLWARLDTELADAGVTVQGLAEQSAEFSGPALEQSYRLFDNWLRTAVDGRSSATRR
jgi:GMP synthase-like glutamine amidotransferase